jgi:hypothetical protein
MAQLGERALGNVVIEWTSSSRQDPMAFPSC